MRPLRVVSWGLAVALLAFAVATYPGLPARVPMHLNASGAATRFVDKSVGSWFLLPGVALASFLLMQWIGSQLPRRPHWFNFPDKERFLRLPAEYRAPAIERMRGVMDLISVGLVLTFLVINVLMWKVAMGEPPGLWAASPFMAFLMTPVILVAVSGVTADVEEAERRWTRDGGGDASPG